jgi:hypothetical protein
MKFKKLKYNPASLLVVQIWKLYSPKERITNFQEQNLIFPNDGLENIISIRNYQGLFPQLAS